MVNIKNFEGTLDPAVICKGPLGELQENQVSEELLVSVLKDFTTYTNGVVTAINLCRCKIKI